jgi:dihydroflavonol-4-reductase
VLTSSFAAVGYGQEPTNRPFTEENWTDPSGRDTSAYVKSKTLAERAAWDFIAREGRALELSVVNPVGVFGPVLGPDYSTSILLVARLMDGAMPGCPRLSFGIVDVRDVADLHLRAMANPAAKGERFLAAGGDFMTIQQIALVLRERMRDAAGRVPTRVLPDWLVRVVARFDASVALIVPELGKFKNATNAKARRVLGWAPRSNGDSVVAAAESLVRLGLVRKPIKAV